MIAEVINKLKNNDFEFVSSNLDSINNIGISLLKEVIILIYNTNYFQQINDYYFLQILRKLGLFKINSSYNFKYDKYILKDILNNKLIENKNEKLIAKFSNKIVKNGGFQHIETKTIYGIYIGNIDSKYLAINNREIFYVEPNMISISDKKFITK